MNEKYIGVTKDNNRALYYAKSLHRRRVYRSSYPIPHSKDFRLFIYKNKNKIEELCNRVNNVYNDDFAPMKYLKEKENG